MPRSTRAFLRRATAAFAALAAAAGGLAVTPAAVAADPAGVIASYDFEDGTARDTSGHGNDLTLAGGAAVESYGDKQDGARALSTRGGTQHAAFPTGMFDGRDEFTISMNYKNRASTGNFFTFAVGQDQNRYLFLRTRYQDLYAGITTASWQKESGTTGTLPASLQNTWHNVALTVSQQAVAIYLDGQPISRTTNVDATISDLGTGLKAYLGRSFYAADPFFDGAFDDITVWDKALSPADLIGPGVVQVQRTEQILAQRISAEGSTKVLDVTLDQWAVGGGETGALSGPAELRLAFLTHSGETLTTAAGGPPEEVTDYSSPVALTLTRADGSTVPYEVRVHTLVAPVRIPGQLDGTGTMGMKFFADPEVFADGGKYYIYPTTDGYSGWNGWTIHAFESSDLVTWVDKGVVVDLKDQDLDGTPDNSILPSRTAKAWAPAMAKRDGRYYLYFSGDGGTNVAVSDRPDGGFHLTDAKVADSIDPAVFQDPATGAWYIAWGQNGIRYARLNPDMRSYDPATLVTQPITGYREGSYITSREYLGKRTYYYMYSVDDTNSVNYRVAYATATSMAGPWTYRGEVLNKDEGKGILGTGHHSVLQVPGTDDWYAVYHAFLDDSMRPRLTDQLTHTQIATGNKRETRIARLTYSEPTAAEVAAGAVPLINRIPVTYEGVPPEQTPVVSVTGAADGRAVVGTTLAAAFGTGWQGVQWTWLRDGVPIAGAEAAQYTVTAADAGHAVAVRAVGESTTGVTNNAGTAAARTDALGSAAVPVAPAGLDVRVEVQTRCVAGKVAVVPTVTNVADVPIDADVASPYGTKRLSALEAERAGSATFSARAASIPAGTVQVTATGVRDGVSVTTMIEQPYTARSCG